MCRWSNPLSQLSIEGLQKRLDHESDFQRNHYRIRSRNRKTRLELYPELETNPRKYNPKNFNMELVYNYLALKVFSRVIKGSSGIVKLMGEYIFFGRKYLGHTITITFDPIEKEWILRSNNGTLLQTSKKGVPSEKSIKAFVGVK